MTFAVSSMCTINSLSFKSWLLCGTNRETPGREVHGWSKKFAISVTNLPTDNSHGEPPLFPIFLKLAERRCLVVGAATLAEPKIEGLLAAGADVLVVAPCATARVKRWALAGTIAWEIRRFEVRDLQGVSLVVVATSSPQTNRAVFDQARARGILCNAVDDREHCDFYYPAVVRRRRLQIAISTGGASPALAQRLRCQLEEQFGPDYAAWLDWLAESRKSLLAKRLSPDRRRVLLHRIASQRSFNSFWRRRTVAPAKAAK
jgi:precorrin-2 dehydrogenase/sirohydrochlorin ferrochelatase